MKAKGTVLKLEFGDGTTLQDLTKYVDEIGTFNKQADNEDTTPFGTTDATWESTGLNRMAAFPISGYYDDDDPGPLIMDARGETRELQITWMTGKVENTDVLIQSFQKTPNKGGFTRFTCQVQPTGALT